MSDQRIFHKRIRLNEGELMQLSKDELISRWLEQETYIDSLEMKQKEVHGEQNDELIGLRESEEKLKQQQIEATRRENVLVMKLTTKEQERQEYANQLQELKQAQNPTTLQLRSALLDPAVNLLFQGMKKEIDDYKEKVEQTQNELSAWKFTPDSNTGKRLIAKCGLLHQENEELVKMIFSGSLAKLEGELALQKNFSEEIKKGQKDLDKLLVELDEDTECMQIVIYMLQQQLKEAKDQLNKVQEENKRMHHQQSQLPHVKEEKYAWKQHEHNKACSQVSGTTNGTHVNHQHRHQNVSD